MKNYSRKWDRIPHFYGAIREECLDAESLEYVLLTAHENRQVFDQFKEHFLSCETCMRRIRALEIFYSILDDEMRQPASPRLVEMARILAEPVE